MPDAPPILTLETGSAWVVILAVSLVTLTTALALRRMIARPGGAASGFLLALPLVVPLIAAAIYVRRGLFPEVGILHPVSPDILQSPSHLLHLLFVSDGHSGVLMPYAVSGSAGMWMVSIAALFSGFMLVRRSLGALMLRRLVSRCTEMRQQDHPDVAEMVAELTSCTRLKRTPQVLLLPPGVSGVFATGLRRPRILLSGELLSELDRDEMEAILAHEIAHLEAKDVQVVVAAGFLRDAVAWNPIAYVAFRKLARDREFEADRRAATLTGRPLSLASGLLKVCERIDRRPRAAQRAALALLQPAGPLARRVTGLIALADGPMSLRQGRSLPYLAAACLVAAAGLQAGARVAASDPTAYAIVWGAPYSTKAEVWSPPSGSRAKGGCGKEVSGRKHLGHPKSYVDFVGGMALREKDLKRWFKHLARTASKTGIPTSMLQWELRPKWRGRPMFSSSGLGPISLLRLELDHLSATQPL